MFGIANHGVSATVGPGAGKRLALAGALLVAFGTAVVAQIPVCPVAILARQPCPGCGLTRAAIALASGNWARAIEVHPLSPIIVPLAVVALTVNLASFVIRGRGAWAEGARGRVVTAVAVLIGVAMVAVWVARFFGAWNGPVAV